MRLSDFDYDLPESAIAQRPTVERDASRLMVLDRATGTISHHRFSELPTFLESDDCLVINETRVRPARLRGYRPGTGGTVEFLLVRPLEDGSWETLAKPGRRLRPGTEVAFEGSSVRAEVIEIMEEGARRVAFDGDVDALVAAVGHVPLPPYIRREAGPDDRGRYQTVYARVEGAIAAPTAGLHFTDETLQAIRDKGVAVAPVLLHVGPGTFKPVEDDDLDAHRMHSEYFELGAAAVWSIKARRGGGGRVVAVGTTTVRVLETQYRSGLLTEGTGWTDIFIYPPYAFKAVDALVTNFHLPRSTLLMLVSALAGREFVLEAYEEAKREGYRFYSYGDAMYIK